MSLVCIVCNVFYCCLGFLSILVLYLWCGLLCVCVCVLVVVVVVVCFPCCLCVFCTSLRCWRFTVLVLVNDGGVVFMSLSVFCLLCLFWLLSCVLDCYVCLCDRYVRVVVFLCIPVIRSCVVCYYLYFLVGAMASGMGSAVVSSLLHTPSSPRSYSSPVVVAAPPFDDPSFLAQLEIVFQFSSPRVFFARSPSS